MPGRYLRAPENQIMNSDAVFYFIHGYPDGPETWDALSEKLGNPESLRFNLHHGPQPKNDSDLIAKHLELLKPALAAGKKIILVAHDLGAVQAWMLLPYLGSQAKAMILFGGLSSSQFRKRITNPLQARRSWYMALFVAPVLGTVAVRFGEKYFLNSIQKLGWQGKRTHLKDFYLYRLFLLHAKPTQKTTVPVLHISGKWDPFLLPITTAEMEDVALNFETEIRPGGHWLQLEQPEWLAQRILEFIQKIDRQ